MNVFIYSKILQFQAKSAFFHGTVLELVNNGDRFGISPLHVAARNKHKSAPDLVLWLVQSGARVTTRVRFSLSSRLGFFLRSSVRDLPCIGLRAGCIVATITCPSNPVLRPCHSILALSRPVLA